MAIFFSHKKQYFFVSFTLAKKLPLCDDFVSMLFLIFFPWNILLKHAITFYNNHRQVLTNTKRCLPRNFSARWDKKFCAKIVIPSLCIVYSQLKLSETAKIPPLCIFSVTRKVFDTFLGYLLRGLPKFSRPINGQLTLSCSQFVKSECSVTNGKLQK